jgi:hypothetical protein
MGENGNLSILSAMTYVNLSYHIWEYTVQLLILAMASKLKIFSNDDIYFYQTDLTSTQTPNHFAQLGCTF